MFGSDNCAEMAKPRVHSNDSMLINKMLNMEGTSSRGFREQGIFCQWEHRNYSDAPIWKFTDIPITNILAIRYSICHFAKFKDDIMTVLL